MAFLDQNLLIGYPVAAAVGLVVGSFINVVILRLPPRLEWRWKQDARDVLELPELYDPPPPGIAVEPSHCPHCKARLRWFENIPLLSWLALRGRCRHCGAAISMQYPLVELLTMLLTLACAWRFGFGWQGFGACLFTWFLVAASGVDARTRLLPDALTLPLLWLGLIAAHERLFVDARDALAGAMVGYAALWSINWLYRQYQVIVRRVARPLDGIAPGDHKLLAAIGAWCGLDGILPSIFLSSLVGAVVGTLWLRLQRKDRQTPLPFGPYLAAAGWITFMWGEALVDAYLRFSGLADGR